MKPRQDIILELKAAGISLPEHPLAVPFAVPEGYFDTLAALVLARIRRESVAAELDELSPLLARISRQMPFAVPAGYFGAEAETPALLAELDRKMPYSIPEGYFETLPELLLERVAPKAKVVRMRPLRWMRMAAAAVVAGAVAVGGWFYTHPTPAASASSAWVENRLNNVPDGALDDFIQTADPVHGTEIARNDQPKTEVRQLLRDVTDGEVDAFLDQVPSEENLNTIN